MVTFRNNNIRRNNFRRNDRNFKVNGDRNKYNNNFSNNDTFQRKITGRNNHNASKLIEKYKFPIIFSTHPRTRKKLEESKFTINKKVNFLKPQSFSNYLKLQINAKTVLSDSGTINEESSILNFPALNVREAHERPEAMEETSVMMTGVNIDRVFQALEVLSSQKRDQNRSLKLVEDYNVDNVSEKVIRIIISYTDFIKKNTWKQ